MISTTKSKAAAKPGISIKSRVKAGFNFVAVVSKPSPTLNHNQAVKGLRVKSRVRAGDARIATNHNQAAKGLRVKSRVKAGIRLSDVLVSSY
jgi:hypothetical protein